MSNLSELLPSGGGQNLVEFVASGTLPNGKPVILNSDGTVTVVAETPIPESIPAGSEVVFNSGSSRYHAVAFDPNTAGKFVVAYQDDGNSRSGTVVVGTVSGTSISFGSEYVFNSGYTAFISVEFDPDTANKFVLAYHSGKALIGTVSGTAISFGSEYAFNSSGVVDASLAFDPSTSGSFVVAYSDDGNSEYGTAVAGTVSGTTLSFGSDVVYNAGSTATISVAFDPNTAGKFVVIYRDAANSNYGTAAVGTVSGTSVSFGSEYVFNSASSFFSSLSFDPNTAGKFITTYNDGTNSSYGTAIIGTVSGTSITYGSEYVFNSGTTDYTSVAFDPNTANKFVVLYQDRSNSSYGTAVVGTVSGTSISLGSENIFNSGSSEYISVAFDPNTAGKFVTAYRDVGNLNYGASIVGQMSSSTTNLTATNLIGITSEAASSGGTAKINTWGGINEAQTSLTIASDYYAQVDGTITTATAGQKLGTAISATTINIKDLT